MDTFLAGKILRILQNAHTLNDTIVCCVALQTAPQNVCLYIRLAVRFLRASHLNIFEQPPDMGFLKNPMSVVN